MENLSKEVMKKNKMEIIKLKIIKSKIKYWMGSVVEMTEGRISKLWTEQQNLHNLNNLEQTQK